MADPFGRAIRDWYRGDLDEPLLVRDGDETREHPIEAFYFTDPDPADPVRRWWDRHLSGPLVDLGAGAGTDALYWQDRFETVAVEVSDHLLEITRDRGVEDARRADMFALTDAFPPDRFRSATVRGTQLGLAGSREGLAAFFDDLARVTTGDATAVVDAYDPSIEETADLLGYRADVATGLAFRTMAFEYGGDLGETLLFRLFRPDRLREATAETPWTVVDVQRPADGQPGYYAAALEKR